MASADICPLAAAQSTPQHTMPTVSYPDSGLGLDYDSDTEEAVEEELPSGNSKNSLKEQTSDNDIHAPSSKNVNCGEVIENAC